MTFIASYQNGNALVMLGDLLLSNPVKGRTTEISLPTRFVNTQPSIPGGIVGLKQKLTIVNSSLAVACAGSPLIAKAILKEISRNIDPPYDNDTILSVIDNMGLSETEKTDVGMIFYSLQPAPSGYITTQPLGYLVYHWRLGEHNIKYAGSGSGHFLGMMGLNEGKIILGNTSSFAQTVKWLLGGAIKSFVSELLTEKPHSVYYGGGFQLLYLNVHQYRFEMLPYAIAIWLLRSDGTVELVGPIFSQTYTQEGCLIIDRLHKVDDLWTPTRYILNPLIGRRVCKNSLPAISFDSDIWAHYIIDQAGQDNFVICNIFDKETFRVRFSYKNTYVDVYPQLLEQIRSQSTATF